MLDQDLPHAESYAAFHFYASYLAAETPENKREAIKAYYLKRQELNAPLFGKEEEGIRDLLATCDAEIVEAQPELKPEPEPEIDECEAMLGPDVHKAMRLAQENPFA